MSLIESGHDGAPYDLVRGGQGRGAQETIDAASVFGWLCAAAGAVVVIASVAAWAARAAFGDEAAAPIDPARQAAWDRSWLVWVAICAVAALLLGWLWRRLAARGEP